MTEYIIHSGIASSSLSPITDGNSLLVSAGGTAISAAILGGSEEVLGEDRAGTVTSHGFEGVTLGGRAKDTKVTGQAVQSVTSTGTALSATITSGAVQIVSDDGVASATTVSSGGTEIISLGGILRGETVAAGGFTRIEGFGNVSGSLFASASDLTIDSGGWVVMSAYASASHVTVKAGGLFVAYGGTATNVTVDSGGYAIVTPFAEVSASVPSAVISAGIVVVGADGAVANDGSSANGLALSSGQQAFILPHGIASGGSVGHNALLTVFSGGEAAGLTVSDGIEIVSAGGTGLDATIAGGGVEYAFSGATVVGTAVSGGGFSLVDSGGLALRTVLSSGGLQAVDGVADNTDVQSGGVFYVVSPGSALDAAIGSGGQAFVFGTIADSEIQSGGFAEVAGGIAIGTTIDTGAEFVALSATTLQTVVSSGGVMLSEKGSNTNTTVDSGGTLILLEGAHVSLLTSETGADIISGGVVTISGGTAITTYSGTSISGLVLTSGATNFVLSGGTDIGTMIGLNAIDSVGAGGTGMNDIIGSGGTLIAGFGGATSGSVTFDGAGGLLTLDSTGDDPTIVSGFALTDTINFNAIKPIAGYGATLSGNTLVVSNGTSSASLQLSGAYGGYTVSASPSGGGGLDVTLVSSSSASQTTSPPTSGAVQPVDIPIYLVPYENSYKVGIEVSLDGGQTYKMVELDTGASGFFASYSPDWWSSYSLLSTTPQVMSYVSGNSYTYQAVNTSVTLQTTSGTPLTIGNVHMGLIDTASDSGVFTPQDWNSSVANDPITAPLQTYFYGDFGLGLNDNNGLEEVLGQISGGLANGFIINIGSYPGESAGQIGYLQVGLTASEIATYGTIALDGQDTVNTFNNSHNPTYAKSQAAGSISADGSTTDTHFIFDTGATHTTIFNGTTLSVSGLTSDSVVVLDAPVSGGTEIGWALTINSAGIVSGIPDRVSVGNGSSADNPGSVNTGIGAYYNESVLYDVADGVMGFFVACFAEGTRIRTQDGERAVEMLAAGDAVITLSGAAERVRWVGYRAIDCTRHPEPDSIWPVRISAHAFGPGEPARDLFLSPDHALYREGVLIPVKHLVNGSSVVQVARAHVTYYHLDLGHHDVILAEGLAAETYLDSGDRGSFTNGGVLIAAHAHFGAADADVQLLWAAQGYAPLVVTGPEIERQRALLECRVPANRECPIAVNGAPRPIV